MDQMFTFEFPRKRLIRVLDNKNQLNTKITGQANSNIGLEQPQKFVLIELKNVF
jgi:hypothetical protein